MDTEKMKEEIRAEIAAQKLIEARAIFEYLNMDNADRIKKMQWAWLVLEKHRAAK